MANKEADLVGWWWHSIWEAETGGSLRNPVLKNQKKKLIWLLARQNVARWEIQAEIQGEKGRRQGDPSSHGESKM